MQTKSVRNTQQEQKPTATRRSLKFDADPVSKLTHGRCKLLYAEVDFSGVARFAFMFCEECLALF